MFPLNENKPAPAAPGFKPIPLKSIHIGTGFRCKVPLQFETDKFVVKTVDSTPELKRVLKLRYDVYYRELIERDKIFRIDRDRFDKRGDHIVVIERSSGDFIATYRLFCSTFSKRFYSETEFDIDAIKELPGHKLELGRACVRRDYRKGVMIILLWRAIAQYLQATGAKYLFGCSSVKTMSVPEIAKVYALLAREYLSQPIYRVYPKARHRIRDFDEHVRVWDDVELVDSKRAIAHAAPPLLQLYFDIGSVICGQPALDRSFRCADFLTLLDIDQMPASARKRYGL
jgi:putative hemolysin